MLESGPNYSPREEDKPQDWLLNLDMSIVEQRKQRGIPSNSSSPIALLLEVRDSETGIWPRGEDGKHWVLANEDADVTPVTDLGDGVVGLYNMG